VQNIAATVEAIARGVARIDRPLSYTAIQDRRRTCPLETGRKPSEMKLLVYSHYFAPSVGGVESIVFHSPVALPECAIRTACRNSKSRSSHQTPAGNYDDAECVSHSPPAKLRSTLAASFARVTSCTSPAPLSHQYSWALLSANLWS